MPIRVDVLDSCTIAALPLVFLMPVPVNAQIDRTTTITVSCPPNTAYTIDLDDGLNAQGGGGFKRRVKHATLNDYMNYELYQNGPGNKIWGQGNSRNFAGNSGLSGVSVHTIFGRLQAKSNASAGQYRDVVTVTVNY
jgi:spore coat protein U-like protein